MAKFKIFLGRDYTYYWHLIANNGEKVCWAEGYTTKQGARDSIEFTKKNGPNAPIEEV